MRVKYWDRSVAKLALVSTDEMNSEGNGSLAQHQVLAMAWEMGYIAAHPSSAHAEASAEITLRQYLATWPHIADILAKFGSVAP